MLFRSFINLKSFTENYMECKADLLISWTIEQADKPKKRFIRGGRGRGRYGRGGRG